MSKALDRAIEDRGKPFTTSEPVVKRVNRVWATSPNGMRVRIDRPTNGKKPERRSRNNSPTKGRDT